MDLVVDANVIIAALISPTGHTADFFFSDQLSLYTPESLLEEVQKYKLLLLSKTGLSEEDWNKELLLLSNRIKFFPWSDLADFLSKAEELSPDPKDAVYFALALKLNCSIWSNDKLLKKQDSVRVISTSELLAMFK